MPSGSEWIIVLVIVLLVFGGSQLPKLAKNLGKAQKEFKDGLAEGSEGRVRRQQLNAPLTASARSSFVGGPSTGSAFDASFAASLIAAADSPGRRGRDRSAIASVRAWVSCSWRRLRAVAASGSGAARVRCSRPTRRARCGDRGRARGTWSLTGTACADLAGLVDADTVAREEGGRRVHAALAVGHPSGRRVRIGEWARVHVSVPPGGRGGDAGAPLTPLCTSRTIRSVESSSGLLILTFRRTRLVPAWELSVTEL